MKLLVHDLSEEDFKKVCPVAPENTEIVSDNGKILACVGCFGCWVKTPGTCVLKDGYENFGKHSSDSEKTTFISKLCYGGYSPFIKNVVDRTLSGALPFFEVVDGLGTHPMRYEIKCVEPSTFIFYGENVSDEEKELTKIVLGAHPFFGDSNVIFCNSLEEVAKEVSVL